MYPKFTSVILFFFTVITVNNTVDCDERLFRDDLKQLASEWFEIGDIFQSLLYPHRSTVASKLIATASQVPNISSQCELSLQQLSRDLLNNKLWAIEMLDNSVSASSGFLRRWVEFGDFDSCLDISNVDEDDATDIPIHGQYCMVEVAFALPHPSIKESIESINLTLSERYSRGHWLERGASVYKMLYTCGVRFSLCSPSTCTPSELENIINQQLPKNVPFKAKINPLSCSSNGEENTVTSSSLPTIQLTAQIVLLSLTSIVILSPLLLKYTESSCFLCHFDIVSNTQKLYSPTSDPLARRLTWVHGARILYLMLAISFHLTLLATLWTPETQSKYIFSKYSVNFPLWSEFFSNMTIGISVNFTIGGMLTWISWYPVMKSMKGSLSLTKYVFARWIRTLPLVTGALLIVLATPVTFASGPVWKIGWSKVINNCLSNWSFELLYTSNLLPVRSSCLPYAWYLSVDMQLYILSFVLLIVIFKSFKYGALIACVTCVTGVVYQGYYLHVHSLKYTADYSSNDIERLLEKEIVLHVGFFNYISSYTIGIVLGYAITSGYRIESALVRTIGWIVFVSLGLSVHLIPLVWKANGGVTSRTHELIFGALQRSIYSIAFSYGFFNGSNDQAGFLNTMAQWSILLPLGRLSSSMFIGHFFVIWYETFTTRQSMAFDLFSLTKRFIHTCIFSVFIGYFIYIVFEAPFLNFGKSLISNHKRKQVEKVE